MSVMYKYIGTKRLPSPKHGLAPIFSGGWRRGSQDWKEGGPIVFLHPSAYPSAKIWTPRIHWLLMGKPCAACSWMIRSALPSTWL
jgi:hypothetical protein